MFCWIYALTQEIKKEENQRIGKYKKTHRPSLPLFVHIFIVLQTRFKVLVRWRKKNIIRILDHMDGAETLAHRGVKDEGWWRSNNKTRTVTFWSHGQKKLYKSISFYFNIFVHRVKRDNISKFNWKKSKVINDYFTYKSNAKLLDNLFFNDFHNTTNINVFHLTFFCLENLRLFYNFFSFYY